MGVEMAVLVELLPFIASICDNSEQRYEENDEQHQKHIQNCVSPSELCREKSSKYASHRAIQNEESAKDLN